MAHILKPDYILVITSKEVTYF